MHPATSMHGPHRPGNSASQFPNGHTDDKGTEVGETGSQRFSEKSPFVHTPWLFSKISKQNDSRGRCLAQAAELSGGQRLHREEAGWADASFTLDPLSSAASKGPQVVALISVAAAGDTGGTVLQREVVAVGGGSGLLKEMSVTGLKFSLSTLKPRFWPIF